MKIRLFISLMLIHCLGSPVLAGDTCDIAADVADKAYQSFQDDKAKGLKLFIKAARLCSYNPKYGYNLGLAYYQSGNLAEAEKYLAQAVADKGDRAIWRNNLAIVLLERGKGSEAIIHAKKGYSLQKTPFCADTLARAELATGQHYQSLLTIHEAKKKWPNEELLATTYKLVMDQYLAYYFDMVKNGDRKNGLAGLQKVDFDDQGVRAYCLTLLYIDQIDTAIQVAEQNKDRFPGLESFHLKLLDQKIRSFYELFRQGEVMLALKNAKSFSEQYPDNKQAKQAYDQLLDAFLADASTIEDPEPSTGR